MWWVVKAPPRPLYPRERPGTHCIGGCVGPMAGLDGCGEPRLPPGFDPWTVQPLASRYTDSYPGPDFHTRHPPPFFFGRIRFTE